jgi:hypothetical protein
MSFDANAAREHLDAANALHKSAASAGPNLADEYETQAAELESRAIAAALVAIATSLDAITTTLARPTQPTVRHL